MTNEVVTNNQGIALIEGLENHQTYIFSISADNHKSEVLEIVTDGTNSYNVTLNNLYRLSITVTDGENALQGVSVTIDGETHITGSAGGCSFNLINGDYEVTFTKEGYTSKTENITVNGDTNSNVVMNDVTTNVLTYDASINRTFSTHSYATKPFNFTGELLIDWGDGNSETVTTNKQLSHTYDNDYVYTITIKGNITSINQPCFYQCNGLKSIDISNTVTSLETLCFSECSNLTNVTIPNSVTNMGNSCFSNCRKLSNIIIPNNLINMGVGCFLNCSSLTNVTIPNTITDLGASSFNNCTSLTYISIPSSIINIGEDCFRDCSNLIDYQLYWTNPSISYDQYKLPNNENSIFTIPNGTKQLYINRGYPLNKLIERND